jgi:hypothetical protein
MSEEEVNSKPETPVGRAIKRRKELQEALKASTDAITRANAEIQKHMQELGRIDIFLKEHYRFSGENVPPLDEESPILGSSGHGNSQSLFEALTRTILLENGEPMDTTEVVKAFQKRQHPLGGSNEWKTASNRLWKAKSEGTFEHFEGKGYWPADVPCPAIGYTPLQGTPKRETSGRSHGATGRPQGRRKILTPEQVQVAERMLLEGKTKFEVAEHLGGVSPNTIYNLFKDIGGIRGLRKNKKEQKDSETPESGS